MLPKELLFTKAHLTVPANDESLDNVFATRSLVVWQSQVLNGNCGRSPIALLMEKLAEISLEEAKAFIAGVEDLVKSPEFNRQNHETLLFWIYHACLQMVKKAENISFDRLELFEEANNYIQSLFAGPNCLSFKT